MTGVREEPRDEWDWVEDSELKDGTVYFIHNVENGLTVFIDKKDGTYKLRVQSIQEMKEYTFTDEFDSLKEAQKKGAVLMEVAIEEFEAGGPM